jgi:hypothetical protein
MKLWIYRRMLNALLKTNSFKKIYLRIWELYHIEKMKSYR